MKYALLIYAGPVRPEDVRPVDGVMDNWLDYTAALRQSGQRQSRPSITGFSAGRVSHQQPLPFGLEPGPQRKAAPQVGQVFWRSAGMGYRPRHRRNFIFARIEATVGVGRPRPAELVRMDQMGQ